MREFQTKPFSIIENPDFSNCHEKSVLRDEHYSASLSFFSDKQEVKENNPKVIQSTTKIEEKTHASPRDLNEMAFEAVPPTPTPSIDEGANIATTSMASTLKRSNFNNALIY